MHTVMEILKYILFNYSWNMLLGGIGIVYELTVLEMDDCGAIHIPLFVWHDTVSNSRPGDDVTRNRHDDDI